MPQENRHIAELNSMHRAVKLSMIKARRSCNDFRTATDQCSIDNNDNENVCRSFSLHLWRIQINASDLSEENNCKKLTSQ